MSAVGKLVRKSQASIFWCMRGLPKAKREAIYTLYAFCRHIDNLIDSSTMAEAEKKELLDAWHHELENIYVRKVPATDIGRKIYKNCMRFKIEKNDFSAILNSALMDFPKPLQCPTLNDFEKYCYGSSVIPVYITLHIIGGMSEKQMRELADCYGHAMHLTNILKDVKEDAMTGHLYAPKELLTEVGIKTHEPLTVVTDKNLIIVREKLAKTAAADFDKAFAYLAKADQKQTRPLRFILHIYKCFFDIMNRRGWEIMSPKPEIKFSDKLAIIFNTLRDQ